MKAKEALLNIKDVIESYGDEKVRHSFYLEFNRRLWYFSLHRSIVRRVELS